MSRELLDKIDTSQKVVPVAKAYFIGEEGGVQSTVLVEQEKSNNVFTGAGALDPAYDPNVLALIFENASALRPNVDAYITNIDSFGHSYVPMIELDSDEAPEKIRDALRIERERQKRDPSNATKAEVLVLPDEPTDEEVDARVKQLATEIRMERARLGTFFENCTPDMPFSGPEGLRGLTRQDIEVLGNGYWEVLRNGLGEVCQFNFIPGISVRLLAVDDKPTEVEIERRISMLSTEKAKVRKKFRRYVQVSNGGTVDVNILVYFKEFGDPRVISSKTGKVYQTPELMQAEEEEKGAPPATEIIAFKISSPRSVYGVPRWIGALLAVMGTRQSEEVNFLYFENRSVPPMAILVSGGRLNDNTVARLTDYISNEIRGKRNFHKIMILEAESGESNMGQPGTMGRMKIEIKPLTDAQQKDGLFMSFEEKNADKVGQMFRLPRILRGDVRDFNRSCHDERTETLTENGWKTYDQIGPDEKIAVYDAEKDLCSWAIPQKKLVYDVVDEELIHFENDDTDVMVTHDHRMYVKSGNTDSWQVMTAEEAAGLETFEFKTMSRTTDTVAARPISTRLERAKHVSRVAYTGKVYCFSVPEFRFFVTRRNKKFAIQGNTAEASIDFAEIQVFGPIRQQFDWVVNKLIFPALGIKYHTFRSNAPTVRDPEQLSRMVALMASSNILTPAEARNLAQDVFNQAFANISDDWVKKPIAITLAELNIKLKEQQGGSDGGAIDSFEDAGGMSTSNAGATQRQAGVQQKPKTTPPDRTKPKPKSKDDIRAQAKAILKLRKALKDAEAGDTEDLEEIVIKVPDEEFYSWFKREN